MDVRELRKRALNGELVKVKYMSITTTQECSLHIKGGSCTIRDADGVYKYHLGPVSSPINEKIEAGWQLQLLDAEFQLVDSSSSTI